MLLAASGLLVLQAPSLRGSLPFAQHPSCLQPIMRATGDSVEVTIGGMHVRLFIRDGQLRVQAHRVGQAGNMVGAALTLPADAASGEAQEHEALPAPAATTTAPESEADVPAASPAAAEPVLDDGLRARLEGQLEPREDWAPAARISRAWQAGLAARRQLQGLEVSPTPGLPLENRIYVILRAPNPGAPTWCRTWRRASELVGTLPQALSVYHGFPSQAEGAAYSMAAGLPGLPQAS